MQANTKKIKTKIQDFEITQDNLTSRSGLNFFVKYLEQIKILGLLIGLLNFLRKSKKGAKIYELLKQVLCFFADGTYKEIAGFDKLKKDKGYCGVIETAQKDMCSSSTIKRFFEKFTFKINWIFDKILIELFIWRLKQKAPKVIELFMDTYVLNNHSCQKREGVEYTYKKVKGYQPLNIVWDNFLISTILKPGNRHALSEGDAKKRLIKIVRTIRKRYSETVQIILKIDGGFLDESLFKTCEDLNIYFISIMRQTKIVKEDERAISKTLDKKRYENDNNSYLWSEFGYKCQSWNNFYRVIYTELENENGQCCFDFIRDKTLIVTNLKKKPDTEYPKELEKYFKAETIIKLNHSRGKDELTHRGIKDFGTEKLPFQKFNQNAAFYYLMIISYFLFTCFKQDILNGIIPIGSYASTIRRKIIDIAGKIVKTAGKIILKINEAAYNYLKPYELLIKINNTIPLIN